MVFSDSEELAEEEKQETSEGEEEEGIGYSEEEEESNEEQEEKQETSEEENEGASDRSAASENEQEGSIALASCSREETQGTKRKLMLPDAQDCKDEHTLSWVPTALANINSIDRHMLCSDAFTAHPSPKTCLPDLERVRGAALALVHNTDAAISLAKAQQNLLDRAALEGKLSALQKELAQSTALQKELAQSIEQSQAEGRTLQKELEQSMEQSRTERRKQDALLQQAKAELLKRSDLFQKEKESLSCSHKREREALVDKYTHEQRDLKRQLEEEKDKSICCVCHDKPRDTIILPCLHFQYCFSCLLRHREANSNTCPTCRGPIQGLSMSSYLATQ